MRSFWAIVARRGCQINWAAFGLLICFIVLPPRASAAVATNWNATTGSWFDVSNWTDGVPTSAQQASINNGGTAQVAAPGATADEVFVGNGSSGSLEITGGGTLSTLGFRSTVGNGAVTVSGEGSTWHVSGLEVGSFGTGTLTISDKGTVNGGATIGASNYAVGSVLVTGAGSHWIGGVTVGGTGSGQLTISDGAQVTSSGVDIAESTNASQGTATVTGQGSTWSTGALSIGRIGTGKLFVSAGAVVTSSVAYVGQFSSFGNEAHITGSDSRWNVTGTLYVGDSGKGSLSISDGSVVTAQSDTTVGRSGTGTISFDNGTLNTAGLLAAPSDLSGTGTINALGLVSDLDLAFDAQHGLQQQIGLAAMPNQQVTVNLDVNGKGSMGAGYSGQGSLKIGNGVSVGSTFDFLGYKAGSIGVATIDGTGSKWTGKYMNVGLNGTGTLNVTGGGVVATAVDSVLGSGSGSVGNVTVQGIGSTWASGGALKIGPLGKGQMLISGGGSVQSGTAQIAGAPNGRGPISGIGTVTVSGVGSSWTNTGNLLVCYSGTGTLTISDGGVVSNSIGEIGGTSSANGTVTVSGAGSSWNNSSVKVGVSGPGTISVLDGGSVTATSGVTVGAKGKITGSGAITGSVSNGGVVAPGSSPGTLRIRGDYQQTSTGSLAIEIGGELGGQYDVLDVDGSATLTGKLDVQLYDLGGGVFAPQAGDSFPILVANGGVANMFQSATLPDLGTDLAWKILYGASSVSLVATLPADFNGDGAVNAADYAVWRSALAQTVPKGTGADGDFDGKITAADFDVWRAHFGQVTAGGAAAAASGGTVAVPEPRGLSLFLSGICVMVFGWRWRPV